MRKTSSFSFLGQLQWGEGASLASINGGEGGVVKMGGRGEVAASKGGGSGGAWGEEEEEVARVWKWGWLLPLLAGQGWALWAKVQGPGWHTNAKTPQQNCLFFLLLAFFP